MGGSTSSSISLRFYPDDVHQVSMYRLVNLYKEKNHDPDVQSKKATVHDIGMVRPSRYAAKPSYTGAKRRSY